MQYFQFYPYRQAATWSNGGTYRETLPETGFLSSIYFHAYRSGVTDSMNAYEKWRLLDFITNLKVIGNGSEVLKDVTGQIAHYLQWADGGPHLTDQHFNYGSSTKRMHCWLNFGRFPGDREYGLDLALWDNIELQFTNEGSSTYFGGDWAIDIALLLMRNPTAPRPFSHHFRTEVWRQITTEQDKEYYLNLPTMHRLRRFIVQVIPALDAQKNASASAYNVLENVKLSLQDGKEDVYNGGLRDLWYANFMQDGRLRLAGGEPYQTSGYGIWTGLGQAWYKAGIAMPQGGAGTGEHPQLEPGNDGPTQKHLRTATDNNSQVWFGASLENCSEVPFAYNEDPASYINLETEKTVQCQLTVKNASSAADGTLRVVLDRMYPN